MIALDQQRQPYIVGIGGTTRGTSSTGCALAFALHRAQLNGARSHMFDGTFLHSLPYYIPDKKALTDTQYELISNVRQADAVIIATPGYHGSISGLVKNALDTLEELRNDERPYLDGRAVGCIVTTYGCQTAGTVLMSLRAIVHSLRGWPTPFGASIDTRKTCFDNTGSCSDTKIIKQLETIGIQVAEFAHAFILRRAIQQQYI
ncbi:MAG: NAD(P)H-dependent oxidoreductase [Burkholderia sp.]|nr:NAD(P)H-dependent oxidoreductase [Burkholderia sp.]